MFSKIVAAYCVFFLSGIAIVQGVLPDCQLLESTLTAEYYNVTDSGFAIITELQTSLSNTINTSLIAATALQQKIENTFNDQTNVEISTCLGTYTTCIGDVSNTADNPCIAAATQSYDTARFKVRDLGYVIRDNCCGDSMDLEACAKAQADLPIVTAHALTDLKTSLGIGLQCIVEYGKTVVELEAQQCSSALVVCARQTCELGGLC